MLVKWMQYTWISRRPLTPLSIIYYCTNCGALELQITCGSGFVPYLTNRVHCVSVNGTVSDFLPVLLGVPHSGPFIISDLHQ